MEKLNMFFLKLNQSPILRKEPLQPHKPSLQQKVLNLLSAEDSLEDLYSTRQSKRIRRNEENADFDKKQKPGFSNKINSHVIQNEQKKTDNSAKKQQARPANSRISVRPDITDRFDNLHKELALIAQQNQEMCKMRFAKKIANCDNQYRKLKEELKVIRFSSDKLLKNSSSDFSQQKINSDLIKKTAEANSEEIKKLQSALFV